MNESDRGKYAKRIGNLYLSGYDPIEVQILNSLRSSFNVVYRDIEIASSHHQQGFCKITFHGQGVFDIWFTIFKSYKTEITDPTLLQGMLDIEAQIVNVNDVNQRLVDLVAGYLKRPAPLDKNMARNLKRAIGNSKKRVLGSYFAWGPPEDYPLYMEIIEAAAQNGENTKRIRDKMVAHIDGMLEELRKAPQSD